MWNKDLKSVYTYREPSQESIGTSIAAFVVCGLATVAWIGVCALIAL